MILHQPPIVLWGVLLSDCHNYTYEAVYSCDVHRLDIIALVRLRHSEAQLDSEEARLDVPLMLRSDKLPGQSAFLQTLISDGSEFAATSSVFIM